MRTSGQPRPKPGNAGMWAGGGTGGKRWAECRLISVLLACTSSYWNKLGERRLLVAPGQRYEPLT